MRISRDFYNCANCKFGTDLKDDYRKKYYCKMCDLNTTQIKANGVCSYYIWNSEKFEDRKLKVVDY